jgi:hypothetical protein
MPFANNNLLIYFDFLFTNEILVDKAGLES